MPRKILVIEYEPRYTQRIQDALVGSSIGASVVRTGEDAQKALTQDRYDLIVLSTIIPRFSTSALVEMIRRTTGEQQKILFTTSGYSGVDPSSDARKLGGTDMLLKPYSSEDFFEKLQSMIGTAAEAAVPAENGATAQTVRMSKGELREDLPDKPSVDDSLRSAPTVEKPVDLGTADPVAPTEKHRKMSLKDVDKLLEDTLSGVRIPNLKTLERKKRTEEREVRRREESARTVDKLLEDTLSGLEGRTAERPGAKAPEQAAEVSPFEEPAPFEEPPPFDEDPPFAEALIGAADETGTSSPPPARESAAAASEQEHHEQYTFIEKIATGGMAEVWKARMHGLEGFEKIVAIKKILPHLSDNEEFIEMFVDEAKLAAQLNHNNIIHIYDLGNQDGSWYIAMEYIDGDDLKSLLRTAWEKDHPLPVPLALFAASKIAWALDYAHRKRGFEDEELGLVHRDVSPQNVLISKDGDIKLCDFGIAKAASKASHTQAGVLKGKLQYMSPEQAWGKPIDQRSDIFATSAVLFEMLSGRKLFMGDSEISVLDQVREARIPAPSLYNDEVTDAIDEVVLKGLEKNPDDRYQTAADLARSIDEQIFSFKPAPTNLDLASYVASLEAAKRVPTMERPIPTRQQPAALRGMDASDEISPHQVMPPSEGSRDDSSTDEDAAAVVVVPMEDSEVGEPHGVEDESVPFAVDREEEESSGSRLPLIAAIVIFGLIGLAAGAWWFMGNREGGGDRDTAELAGAPGSESTSPALATDTRPLEPIGLTEEALEAEQLSGETGQPTTDEPVLTSEDNALIEAQVRERVESDRRRLENEGRAAAERERKRQQAEEQARREASRKAEPPPVVKAKPAEPQPKPVDTESEPAPRQTAEVVNEPEPVVETEPETPPTRRGDFVAPGTPGLVDPEMVSLGRKRYPPLARRNRVEGIVIIRALVSETGKVLEAEVLRGVAGSAGLNEAAIDMVRGGEFRPGTKDGVQVRAYKTVTVPFRL